MQIVQALRGRQALVSPCFSGIGRNKREHFTIYIIRTLFHKFFANMPGYGFNVRLQHLHILKNGVVDTLQNIVRSIGFSSGHFVRVINQSRT